jgi:hypothetical protein
MSRLARSDAALDVLNEERDHIAIQISLLSHAETPDLAALTGLRRKLDAVERRIANYSPGEP